MNILDSILDAYYAVRFKVEDAIEETKFRIQDVVYRLKEHKEVKLEEVSPKKKKAKKKKKKK